MLQKIFSNRNHVARLREEFNNDVIPTPPIAGAPADHQLAVKLVLMIRFYERKTKR